MTPREAGDPPAYVSTCHEELFGFPDDEDDEDDEPDTEPLGENEGAGGTA
ncbi:hypothetical protein [Actinomadura bangladeshensis]|uniref:Uncharacterized protein n=1 Tax=Actinomadura bangladeshensis TaxID=453573 RepID=A0A6L9QC24_9ACTN|nr:hypothetical protein [Actinomadura bangladeshensis]NEA22608.1 hypothetical protein [Actinomadura bangladeshensis]